MSRKIFFIVLTALLAAACASANPSTPANPSLPSVTPDQVVVDFYAWFLDRSAAEPKDIHQSDHLSPGFIQKYDEAIVSGGPGGGISMVCAQDFPESVEVTGTDIRADSATVTAATSFGSTLQIEMKVVDGAWKIDQLTCK